MEVVIKVMEVITDIFMYASAIFVVTVFGLLFIRGGRLTLQLNDW